MRIVDGQKVLNEAERLEADDAENELEKILHSQNALIEVLRRMQVWHPHVDMKRFKEYIEEGFGEAFADEWFRQHEACHHSMECDRIFPDFKTAAAKRGIEW